MQMRVPEQPYERRGNAPNVPLLRVHADERRVVVLRPRLRLQGSHGPLGPCSAILGIQLQTALHNAEVGEDWERGTLVPEEVVVGTQDTGPIGLCEGGEGVVQVPLRGVMDLDMQLLEHLAHHDGVPVRHGALHGPDFLRPALAPLLGRGLAWGRGVNEYLNREATAISRSHKAFCLPERPGQVPRRGKRVEKVGIIQDVDVQQLPGRSHGTR
mmetsp:Transcript_1438/g.2620  ORF Transcript_1438/g.2620 Transcript_1438/m.2620 type:complete len:213 (-) Transcript_1438:475-1113(-)